MRRKTGLYRAVSLEVRVLPQGAGRRPLGCEERRCFGDLSTDRDTWAYVCQLSDSPSETYTILGMRQSGHAKGSVYSFFRHLRTNSPKRGSNSLRPLRFVVGEIGTLTAANGEANGYENGVELVTGGGSGTKWALWRFWRGSGFYIGENVHL